MSVKIVGHIRGDLAKISGLTGAVEDEEIVVIGSEAHFGDEGVSRRGSGCKGYVDASSEVDKFLSLISTFSTTALAAASATACN